MPNHYSRRHCGIYYATITDDAGTFELLAMSFKSPDNDAGFLTGRACVKHSEMTIDT